MRIKDFIRGLLHFDDGSELHLREFVDVSTDIERYKYSYHYMRAGHLIVRYDNSANISARDFTTCPHHKHVGDTIQESSAPSLAEVVAEIAALDVSSEGRPPSPTRGYACTAPADTSGDLPTSRSCCVSAVAGVFH
jgi:hypothetical protein